MAAATTQLPTKVGAFPELLRRSRFASFDPTIRQAYGTPPSHLHRGNWGLKRPIAQRKRNAFISLKNYEEHEHYIEWNNMESQVRLIDKIEEINVAPKLVPQVPWYVGLGPAASSYWSTMDTEFAPGEVGMPLLIESERVPVFTVELKGLGQRGKGEYGMKPSLKILDDGYLHPNVRSMSAKVFKRYLKKLRSLRPEFKKFLEENGVSTSFKESGITLASHHIRFLGQHFEKQFQDEKNKTTDVHPNQSQPIRQQPHRLGGLMYASPTILESHFSSSEKPAIVLEDGAKSHYNSTSTAESHLVSTAGIVGRLEYKKAGANVKPAFSAKGLAYPPSALLARQTDGNTFINVKVTDLQLERLPEAVTAFPSANSSKEVSIRMDLVTHSLETDHSRTNTHPYGSMLYNAENPREPSMKPFYRENVNHDRGRMYRLSESGDRPNKLDEEGSPLSPPISNNANILSVLGKMGKVRDNGEEGGVVYWGHRSPKRWQDDQWVEPRDLNANDDGNSGDNTGGHGPTNV
jgi:hypothetical protein